MSDLIISVLLILQCFRSEGTVFNFLLQLFSLLIFYLLLIKFWNEEYFDLAHTSGVLSAQHLTTFFICKFSCLLRNVWFLLDVTHRVVCIEETDLVLWVKTHVLHSMHIETFEMGEQPLVVTFVQHKARTFKLTHFTHFFYWLVRRGGQVTIFFDLR